MADFLLNNNFFEFNMKVKRQKSGTTVGTKFAPPYTRIFMDVVETEFFTSQYLQSFLWLRYIDDIFFIWTLEKKNSFSFLMNLILPAQFKFHI